MRKLTMAALAGLMVAGGAIAGCASDPYYDGYASSRYTSNRYDPYYDRNYYGPVDRPGYTYDSGASVAASVLGSLLGTGSYYGDVPHDRYGPNPHGMRAPDGHRIRCSLRRSYDRYYGATVTRRVCR